MRLLFLYSLAALSQAAPSLFTQSSAGIFGSACVVNYMNCLQFNLSGTGTGTSSATFPGLPNDGVLANGVKVGVSGTTAFASFGQLGASVHAMSYSVTNGLERSILGGAGYIARFTDTITIYGGIGTAYLRVRIDRCFALCIVTGSDAIAFTYGVPIDFGFELRASASLNEIIQGFLVVRGLAVTNDLSSVNYPNAQIPHATGLYYITESGARYGGMLDGTFLSPPEFDSTVPEPATVILTALALTAFIGVAVTRRY